jgi:hypothetical protein
MKPSPRSRKAPSTSRPKRLNAPKMPRFGGASPFQAPVYLPRQDPKGYSRRKDHKHSER